MHVQAGPTRQPDRQPVLLTLCCFAECAQTTVRCLPSLAAAAGEQQQRQPAHVCVSVQALPVLQLLQAWYSWYLDCSCIHSRHHSASGIVCSTCCHAHLHTAQHTPLQLFGCVCNMVYIGLVCDVLCGSTCPHAQQLFLVVLFITARALVMGQHVEQPLLMLPSAAGSCVEWTLHGHVPAREGHFAAAGCARSASRRCPVLGCPVSGVMGQHVEQPLLVLPSAAGSCVEWTLHMVMCALVRDTWLLHVAHGWQACAVMYQVVHCSTDICVPVAQGCGTPFDEGIHHVSVFVIVFGLEVSGYGSSSWCMVAKGRGVCCNTIVPNSD